MRHKGSVAPLAVIVILLMLGFLVHFFAGKSFVGPAKPVGNDAAPLFSDISDWKSYTGNELGFSIKYPKDFSVNENYRYTLALPTDPSQNPIPGVAFALPARFYDGTNLASGSQISVEASKDFCQIDSMQSYGGATGNVPNAAEELGGKAYKEVLRSDAGAGNFYIDDLYSTGVPAANGECYGVRMFLHSTNIGILQETQPNVKEYDKAGITAIFKDMIRTFSTI